MSGPESARLTTVRQRIAELLSDAEVAAEATAAARSIGERFDLCIMGQPISRTLHPKLVSEEGWRHAASAAGAVGRVVRALGERVLEDATLRRELGLPPELEALLGVDVKSNETRVMSRVDGALDEGGRYRVMEVNPRFPGGGYYADELGRIVEGTAFWRRLGETSALRREPTMTALAEVLMGTSGGRPLRTFFPHGEGIEAEWAAQLGEGDALLAIGLAREFGFPMRSGRPQDLVLTDRLRYRDEPVELILTIVTADRVPDLIRPFDPGSPGLPERIAASGAQIFNTVSLGAAMDSKAHLAVISDPDAERFLGGAATEDVAAARAATPWTRVVRAGFTQREGRRVDLLEHLSAHRERFVLKPALGLGGKGVVLGWQTSQDAWDRALRSEGQVQVAQERVILEPEPWAVLDADGSGFEWVSTPSSLDVFVWQDRWPRCAISRLMVKGLMNASQGSSMVPVVVADG